MTGPSARLPLTSGHDHRSPPRVGLVLGAGGVVGQAYQAGVLAALSNDLGWDPREATVIVGSSAGSVTGSLLRLGVSAHDLSAWAIDAPLSGESRAVHAALDDDREFPPLSWRDLVRNWRPPSAALVWRAIRRPWRFRAAVAATTLMPAGRIDIEARCRALDELNGGTWPEGLLLCAVRRSDGQRIVFGRPGAPEATLGQAVAASCAIPGYFRPVEVAGVEYFDGGVHSGTNADVVRDLGLDLVIVIAPMGVDRGRAATGDAVLRRVAHRRLGRELRAVRTNGADVVCFEPSTSVLRAMGLNLMATDRAARVVQEAFFDAGRLANTPENAPRLAALNARLPVG